MSALGARLAWLPTSWPAEALSSWAAQGPLHASGWVALSLAAAVAAVAAGWFLHQQTFVLGLGVFGEAGAGSSRRRRPRAPSAAARRSGPNPVASLARKDFLTLRRDFRRLAGALPALAMAIVYTFVNSGHSTSAIWGVALPIGFVPGIVSLSIALPSVGTEGRGMQLLILAGLPMRTLLLAKLVFAVPIVLAMSLATAVTVSVVDGGGAAQSIQVALLAAWLGCGAPAISVSAGAIGADFTATDPRRGVNAGWSIAGMVMLALFGAFSYGAFFAFWFAATGTLPALLVPLGLLSLAGSAAIVGGMLVAGLRALEGRRPGE